MNSSMLKHDILMANMLHEKYLQSTKIEIINVDNEL